ncbi:kinase phosphorylation protein-domain-containing protein [Chiua virens]|nr:kinase phosphorylation protein-domain-containing protein [Chiua virens]
MFEPIRGGTRGGQAEFKWSDVSADKDREHYLGHSINAPTGRWQKNKDIHWYNRDQSITDAERIEEIRKIKEVEAEALSVALQVSRKHFTTDTNISFISRGFGPTGANAAQPAASSSTGPSITGPPAPPTEDDAPRKREKEERRRRKAERKEEKRARKEGRRAAHHDEQDDRTRHRRSSRSRSSSRGKHSDDGDRRSRSPTRDREERLNRLRDYDETEREKERERHRRLWDMNAARDRRRYRHS